MKDLQLLTSLLLLMLTVCTCKKDESEKLPNPSVDFIAYENGEGMIGAGGGKIIIADSYSPLNGISLTIPKGSLSEQELIKIEAAPDSVKLPSDPDALVIKLSPKGLQFNQPIEILFPLGADMDTSQLSGFYINYEDNIIKQFPCEIENNQAKILTDHFSYYTISKSGIRLNSQMYYHEGPFGKRVIANLWIEGPIEGTDEWGLAGVPVKYKTFSNVLEATSAYENTILMESHFKVKLKRFMQLWFDPTEETCDVSVKTADLSSYGQEVYVKPINYSYASNTTQRKLISNDKDRENYFGGRAICFHFNVELDQQRSYYLEAEYQLLDALKTKWTVLYSFNTKKNRLKPSEMIQENPDKDTDFVMDKPYLEGNDTPVNETGTFTDNRDGKVYKTVKIGDQWWMAENLAYLPAVSPSNQGSDTEPFYYVYDYQETDVAVAKATDNYKTYGVLYNWSAALTACPSGWHLPSDAEWKQLEMALGMTQAQADATGLRGTNQGTQLKATSGWASNGNGTNSSGFSALSGGYRFDDGTFFNVGNAGLWWSSTENNSSGAWTRRLGYYSANVFRGSIYKAYGFSVRCVKDN